MLNKDKQRELCYLVTVDNIKPIEGRDRVECAVIGGWTVMVKKGDFKIGDIGVYFEVDSKVPEVEPFLFLESKHYKIKTQKYKTPNGHFYSQGLLLPIDSFGWTYKNDMEMFVVDNDGVTHSPCDESRFLTNKLNVVYSVKEDNNRKRNVDPIKSMLQRYEKKFQKAPYKYLVKTKIGRNLLFLFYGNKKINRFPSWVKKTDEERVQNMPWVLQLKEPFVVTEKIDGSSTTFTMKKRFLLPNKFIVCSRNVAFTGDKKQQCYYDTNIYLEMADKYNIKAVLEVLLKMYPDEDWVTIQGETYGSKVQVRDYGLKERNFMAFNLITSKRGRFDSVTASQLLNKLSVPFVPILDTVFKLPDTVEELLEQCGGASKIDGGMREGLVIRSLNSDLSFKAVSNEFLLKYHN